MQPYDRRPRIRYWIPEGYASAEGLRADVRSFARRGFGGVEVVSCNLLGQEIPDDFGWGSDAFYDALAIVSREAAECGMVVDIANGPQWPITAPQISRADDPAALYELTYGVGTPNPEATWTTLPERRVTHEEGEPALIAACAYREVSPGVLDERSYVDLLHLVDDERIAWTPEGDPDGWRVFAFWGQPACHKVLDRFYVTDHLSAAGAQASVDWWRDVLAPRMGDAWSNVESIFCDSMEYKVAMEWTRDFCEAFEGRHGYDIRPYLPVVGEAATYPKNDVAGYAFANADLTRAVRRDYAETVSWMYAERHVRVLEEGARGLGKSVRYQVAYNKPFGEEDAALVAGVPENESLGRESLDNLRVMSGAVHIGRKPRYSFEAAAEFGTAYGQTQRDLAWWLKRAAVAGCNGQVLHGASYCGAVDGGTRAAFGWPGWEAFGRFAANNWNRTLSERSFAGHMAAVTRMNRFWDGTPRVDLAFLREEYLNHGHGGDGSFLVADDLLLACEGYTYEFVSPGVLAHGNAQVGGRLDPDGAGYRALVMAGQAGVTRSCMERLRGLAEAGLPVFIVGGGQLAPYSKADLDDLAGWRETRDALLVCRGVHVVDDYPQLVDLLGELGIMPSAACGCDHVLTAHVLRGGVDEWLVYNGNRMACDSATGKTDASTTMPAVEGNGGLVPVDVDLVLRPEGAGRRAYLRDLGSGACYALASEACDNGSVRVQLHLESDQAVVVGLADDQPDDLAPWQPDGLTATALGPWQATAYELRESPDPCDFLAGGYAQVGEVRGLVEPCPAADIPGVSERFAGYVEYACTTALAQAPDAAWLRLPYWSDALELDVNGEAVPVVAGFTGSVDLAGHLAAGPNELRIRVYTNLHNRLCDDPSRTYGMQGEVTLLTS